MLCYCPSSVTHSRLDKTAHYGTHREGDEGWAHQDCALLPTVINPLDKHQHTQVPSTSGPRPSRAVIIGHSLGTVSSKANNLKMCVYIFKARVWFGKYLRAHLFDKEEERKIPKFHIITYCYIY